MAKLKVLQVNKLYYPHIGGIEKVVQEIAEGLRDRVDIQVLVCQPRGPTRIETINGVKVHRTSSLGVYSSMPLSLSFPLQLKTLSTAYDILHFHVPFPLANLPYLLSGSKAKVIVSWHSDVVRHQVLLSLYNILMTTFLQRADKIIVTSSRLIEISAVLRRFSHKCVVIPYGIDIKRFQLGDGIRSKTATIRAVYGARIILFIGRMVHYKGLDTLIRTMCGVDARLLLIGDGPLRVSLQKLTAELGLVDKVGFLGRVSDVDLAAYYHACDVFVLPSVSSSEAFGLVQLEAMACAKPVINTNLPTAVPDVSRNEETGITVTPGDVSALSEAINRILEDQALRQHYEKNALRRVQEQFALPVMLEKIYETYCQVMSTER